MNLGPVEFDRPITSRVTAGVIPVDRFTRRRVGRGVTAAVIDINSGQPLPYRLITNLSGSLVLTDLPTDAQYTMLLDPRDAGYLGPLEFVVDPATDGLEVVVHLDRKPGFPFEAGTTLVRGSVVVADGPVDGAVIAVDGARFSTMSDGRGAFALPLSLPTLVPGEQPMPQSVDLRFDEPDLGSRVLTVTLTDRRTHIFTEPIELDGSNQPPFTTPTN